MSLPTACGALLERRLSEPGTDKVLKKIGRPVTDNPHRAFDKAAKTRRKRAGAARRIGTRLLHEASER
jgi:hypothetical protein